MHTGEIIYVGGGCDMILPYEKQKLCLLFQGAK